MSVQKISIIIPVYNVEKYIDECLQSVLHQTYKNLEIILIDDGSTDSSGMICDKYAEMDNRVRVFHKQNGGVSSARNLGLEKTTGDYITFVDPDDWIELDMIENMVSHFLDNIDAVFCGYWENPEMEANLAPIVHRPEKQGIVDGEEALYQCLIGIGYGYFTSVWNKMFKASFLSKLNIGFENYSIAEDELWLARVVPVCNNVKLISTPLYHWRQSEGSALRGTGNYEKWYSALEAKSKVVSVTKFCPRLYDLSVAKVYNDIFDVVWQAYVEKKKVISKDFLERLQFYEKIFYEKNYFSTAKKMKYLTIKILVKCGFSAKVIEKLGKINAYRIRERVLKK